MAHLLFIIAMIGVFIGLVMALFLAMPEIPSAVMELVSMIFDYMKNGLGIVSIFAPLQLVVTIIDVVIAIEVALLIYRLGKYIYEHVFA